MGTLTYVGIFILAFLSNIVIPVPEELILLGMGYLTGIGIFTYPLVAGIFILGMLLSDFILYRLSYSGSKLTARLHQRLEKRGFLKNQDYLKRNIHKIIFFSRFLVYLRFIGPVTAGLLRVTRKDFLMYDFLALVIYVNIFLGLGNYFHKQISIITEGVARFKNYFLIGIAILVTFFVLRYIQRNFIKWMNKIGEFMPTIIPGFEQEEDDPENKK